MTYTSADELATWSLLYVFDRAVRAARTLQHACTKFLAARQRRAPDRRFVDAVRGGCARQLQLLRHRCRLGRNQEASAPASPRPCSERILLGIAAQTYARAP